jgi:hypothetical protein
VNAGDSFRVRRRDEPNAKPAWLKARLWLILGIALLVHVHAIRSPLILDDHLHEAMLDGVYPRGHDRPLWLSLYDFVNDGNREALRSLGALPWWAEQGVEIRFLRPLASALRLLDRALFGSNSTWMHVHSAVWFLGLLFAANRLFRRLFLPLFVEQSKDVRAAADLATLILGLAPCHSYPLAWVANREILISATFGAVGLEAYLAMLPGFGFGQVSQHQPSVTAKLWLRAFVSFVFCFSAGEYAAGMLGPLLAAEMLLAKAAAASMPRRLARATTYLLPAAIYTGMHYRFGFGAKHSGFYNDPFAETAQFVSQAPRRLLVLLTNAVVGAEAEQTSGDMRFLPLFLVFVLLALGAIVTLRHVIPALAARDGEPNRVLCTKQTLRFLLASAVLCLVPTLAAVPGNRLLALAVMFLSGFIGFWLVRIFGRDEQSAGVSPSSPWANLVTSFVAFFALINAPLSSIRSEREGLSGARKTEAHVQAFRADLFRKGALGDPTQPRPRIVVLRGGTTLYLPFLLRERDQGPVTVAQVSQVGSVLLQREAEDLLKLSTGLGKSLYARYGVSRKHVLGTGAVSGPHFSVDVVEANGEGPRILKMQIPPNVLWYEEKRDGFKEVTLPKVGFGLPLSR